jgi:tetratricopeptide (TPR) repeat protein
VEYLLNLVLEFLQRYWRALATAGALLIPVLLFIIEQRSVRKRQHTEGHKSYREAERKFEKAKRMGSESIFDNEADIELENAMNSSELYKDVIDLCEYAINSHCGEAKVYHLRGLAHYELSQRELALEDFQKAVRQDKSYLPARYYLAITYEDFNDEMQAARHYERILHLEPYEDFEKNLQDHARERLGEISSRQEIIQNRKRR